MLEFETIQPVNSTATGRRILYDFGSNYVGYLCVCAKGKKGDIIVLYFSGACFYILKCHNLFISRK